MRLVWAGKTVSTNRRNMTRCVRGKAMVYQGKDYRAFKTDMIIAFRKQFKQPTISGLCDMSLTLSLWKVKDTDGPVKAIMDALEGAGVVRNDKLIRHVNISRSYHAKNENDIVSVELNIVNE